MNDKDRISGDKRYFCGLPMNADMQEKISTALKVSTDTAEVVYALIEIRKFIETCTRLGENYENIKYWGDWAVHSKMNRKSTKQLLTKMEIYLIEHPSDKFIWSDFNYQFISLEGLRWDLYEFADEYNLFSDFVNLPHWDNFSKSLVNHLVDCPLIKDDGVIREYRFIRKKHIPEAQEYSISYEIIFDGSRDNIFGTILHYNRC